MSPGTIFSGKRILTTNMDLFETKYLPFKMIV